MTSDGLPPIARSDEFRQYHTTTRTATWGFLAALPLMMLYEWGLMAANRGSDDVIRISADVWMRTIIPSFGVSHAHILLGLVAVTGIVIVVLERKKKRVVRVRYAVWMLAESVLYAVVLTFLVSRATAWMVAMAPAGQELHELDLFTQVVLSFGAGIYEELVFRVLLVGGLFLILQLTVPRNRRWIAYALAALIAALIFSAVHYVGDFAYPWEWGSFVYRLLFGLALNVVFLARGFGTAAWTHALYDVMVVTGVLS